MSTNPNSQRSAATAVAELLTENPELPLIDWTISGSGHLSGVAVNEHADMRAMVDRYAVALGGQPSEFRYTSTDGRAMFSSTLFVSWRDVRLSAKGVCLAAALAPLVVAA
ncbi:hypothetical protein AB0D99_10425 [Streptomyces sp. NPDC047971]|uniref:hypothetical protein n=1 Tax=Streptomyces sp. NPDC047971 TaxID=3154499 RepID=UPI0033CAE2D3